ncbi:hypothetical protein ACPC36_14875 [Streptomyces pseudogriseolus]
MQAATTMDGRRAVTVSVHSRSAGPKTVARQANAMHGLVDRALNHGD